MRIVIVTENICGSFGQEKVVSILTNKLLSDGHEVFFIASHGKKNSNDLVLEKLFSLHNLSSYKIVNSYKKEIRTFLHSLNPNVVHIMDQFDSRIMEEVVHYFPSIFTSHTVASTCPASHRLTNDAGVCIKKGGITCLYHQHKYKCLSYLKNNVRRFHAIYNFIKRKHTLKKCKKILAISKYMYDVLIQNNFKKEQVSLVYNPVEVREVTALTDKPKNFILASSRLSRLKGIDRLIKAMSLIKNHEWNLYICGSGPEEENLKKLSKMLNCNEKIKFLGTTSFIETQVLMASCDIFVQPNVGPEGFGLSLAEASALGIPVVAFNVPALNEIIENGKNGLLIAQNNIELLSKTIENLLTNKNYREILGKNGREMMKQKFSSETFYKNILQTYNLVKRK